VTSDVFDLFIYLFLNLPDCSELFLR